MLEQVWWEVLVSKYLEYSNCVLYTTMKNISQVLVILKTLIGRIRYVLSYST